MTFRELFEKAVEQTDKTKKYGGRSDAFYEFERHLKELLKPLVAESEWERFYISTAYSRGSDPLINLYIYNASAEIPFKLKLKKDGKKHSYYGDITYYLPSVAFTCDEALMDQDVITHLDLLFNTSDEVKEEFKKEAQKNQTLADNADLIKSYTDIVNEFNALPAETREQLRYAGLPSLCFW